MMSGADRSVEQSLCERELGDIVIMDNLGSRKSAALSRLIRAAHARLWYLTPYSPDPIRSSKPSPSLCTPPRHTLSTTLGGMWEASSQPSPR